MDSVVSELVQVQALAQSHCLVFSAQGRVLPYEKVGDGRLKIWIKPLKGDQSERGLRFKKKIKKIKKK